MNLIEKVANGRFIRLAEVFPPSFESRTELEPVIGLEQKISDFLRRVDRIRGLVDGFIVADLKSEGRIKISTVFAAYILKERLGVETIPVITARDCNRIASRSNIITAISANLSGVMAVWGDRYTKDEAGLNVYDYSTLTDFIRETRSMFARVDRDISLVGPVNIGRFLEPSGVKMAKERLSAGADLLLAQPPTTDEDTLKKHTSALKMAGILKKVMLNIFPFRDVSDIRYCRERFGWSISSELELKAALGEAELLKAAKRVAAKIQDSGVPGLYVSTRGRPELIRYILE